MNTDILCEIHCRPHQVTQAELLLENIFAELRSFAERFSRFEQDNELFLFNQAARGLLSRELSDMMTAAQFFYQSTGGIFDPSVLPILEQEGYSGAYPNATSKHAFSELTLSQEKMSFAKPYELKIDLGGLGKGYIVDKLASHIHPHFQNFLIDAGGDIFVAGKNKVEDYSYWAIDTEHPKRPNDSLALLLMSNFAVATSGINRRSWQKQGVAKHHLIDTRTKTSADSDLISVTVLAPSTICADVLAKTLSILGKEAGQTFANQYHIPAIFATIQEETIINSFAQPYVWQS